MDNQKEIDQWIASLEEKGSFTAEKNQLLYHAIKEKNLLLAGALAKKGAVLEENASLEKVVGILPALLDSSSFFLLNACIDFLLEYYPQLINSSPLATSEELELTFGIPELRDCKVIVKTSPDKDAELWLSKKILLIPRNITPFVRPLTDFQVNVEDPDALIDLLRFSYDEKITIDEKNVGQLLQTANHYRAQSLKNRCEKWILSHSQEFSGDALLQFGKESNSEAVTNRAVAKKINEALGKKESLAFLQSVGKELTEINLKELDITLANIGPTLDLLARYCPNLQVLTLPEEIDAKVLPKIKEFSALKELHIPKAVARALPALKTVKVTAYEEKRL
jgi:BTB/POZ domain